MRIYSVKDTLAGEFMAPFASVNDATAQRSFEQSFEKTPEYVRKDFELWYLGNYNSSDGKIFFEVPCPRKVDFKEQLELDMKVPNLPGSRKETKGEKI